MSLRVGAEIAHQFRIESVLGQGGFGHAYLVRDLNLGVLRVIKELSAKYLLDDSICHRFVNEAQTMANLNHPHIVTVHQLLKPPVVRDYYIVMEYMAGGSLDHLLDEGNLPVERAVEIVIDVCKGLEPAHNQKIVHRDIKPHNILLSEDGKIIKVGDWGIAHLPDLSLTVGGQPGTLYYMSPEQAQANLSVDDRQRRPGIDGRSDLYSVGVMLFQMLTGQFYLDFRQISHQASEAFRRQHRSPYDIAEERLNQVRMAAILQAIVDQPAQRPSSYIPIPPALESVILKAVEKKPDNRYQTATELMTALQKALKPAKKPDPTIAIEPPANTRVQSAIEEAKRAFDRMQYDQALDMLRRVKAEAPYYPQIYIEMAAAYNFLRRHEEARQLLEEGIKNNPHHATLYRDLGLTYNKLNQPQKAAEALAQSLQLEPNQATVRALLRQVQQGIH